MVETEINKKKVNNKLDTMIAIEILYSSLYDGWACENCGVILGEPKKGVPKYYCEHLTRKVDALFNPLKKRLTQEALVSTLQEGGRNSKD